MAEEYEVTLFVTVENPEVAVAEARRIAVLSGVDEDEAAETYSVDRMEDCLRMILDPGVSPPGLSIDDCSCEELPEYMRKGGS